MKEQLLNKKIALVPEDHQTHRKIVLELDHTYQALEINFSYDPQEVPTEQAKEYIREALPLYNLPETAVDDFLPLVNLITVSLSYESEYIGCRHNKETKQTIRIAPEQSSLGFIPHEIKAGVWEIQLNLHCVRSEVSVHLDVRGVLEA